MFVLLYYCIVIVKFSGTICCAILFVDDSSCLDHSSDLKKFLFRVFVRFISTSAGVSITMCISLRTRRECVDAFPKLLTRYRKC